MNREDIYITSKVVPRRNQTKEQVIETVKTSVRDLQVRSFMLFKSKIFFYSFFSHFQVSYLDLYLIHWPGVIGIPVESPDNPVYRKNTFDALSTTLKDGLVRSIGVSNYTVRHLNELLTQCTDIRPAVNQVEWHPHYHQPELLELCQSEGVFLQAYSSLGSSNTTVLRDDPVIKQVAVKLGKSSAQKLLP